MFAALAAVGLIAAAPAQPPGSADRLQERVGCARGRHESQEHARINPCAASGCEAVRGAHADILAYWDTALRRAGFRTQRVTGRTQDRTYLEFAGPTRGKISLSRRGGGFVLVAGPSQRRQPVIR